MNMFLKWSLNIHQFLLHHFVIQIFVIAKCILRSEFIMIENAKSTFTALLGISPCHLYTLNKFSPQKFLIDQRATVAIEQTFNV